MRKIEIRERGPRSREDPEGVRFAAAVVASTQPRNAFSPVSAWPTTSVWISCVPS